MHLPRPVGVRRLTRALTAAATVAVAGLAVTAAGSTAPTADAVINGQPSGTAPWAVQITSFHFALGAPCVGVVVDPYWVATAAHCGPADPNVYTLGFGNTATIPGGLSVTAPVATPGSVGAFRGLDPGSLGRHTPVAAYHAPAGDLMLLELAHPAPAPAVRRAALDPAPGTILRFHGFGNTADGTRSWELRTGLTRLDAITDRPGSGGTSRIGHNHSVQGGVALGDSGAPLFDGDRLVGLHSTSDRDHRAPDGTLPARYESIPAQNGWIDRMIAEG